MDVILPSHLQKLYETVKKGAKGFHIRSVKPHLDILTEYGAQCKSVTVLGIETGCSCVAFLASGCKKLAAYDANIHPNLSLVRQAAQHDGIPFRLIQKDNLKAKLRRTDLLFIDTDHWYGQIKAELERHHGSVSRWILMHDRNFRLREPLRRAPWYACRHLRIPRTTSRMGPQRPLRNRRRTHHLGAHCATKEKVDILRE